MSPNLIIFLIVLFIVLGALCGWWYVRSHKKAVPDAIQPLEEIVVNDDNVARLEAPRLSNPYVVPEVKNDRERCLLYCSQSKSERLAEFREIFKHLPDLENQLGKD